MQVFMKVRSFSHSGDKGWSGLDDVKSMDSENSLILLFCSPSYLLNKKVLAQVTQDFPQSHIAGCSTSGEIKDTLVQDNSISGIIIQFEKAKVRTTQRFLSEYDSSKEVAASMAQELNEPDLKGLIVLSDGLQTDGTALVNGFNEILHQDTIIAGGLAGDGNNFKETWVYCDGDCHQGAIVTVGLYGEELKLRSSSRGGWDIFGPERVITKSHGNIVYEIDDHPSLDLYKEYLGEKAKDLPASGLLFPLQIRQDKSDDNRLVRTLLAIDEEQKTLTFAGSIPSGCLGQLMKANFDRLIDAVGEGIREEHNNEEDRDEDSFALAVSCVGRRLVLGARTEEELESLKDSLSEKAVIAGFYSYGEIGVNFEGKACELHNQSLTLLTIHEKVK